MEYLFSFWEALRWFIRPSVIPWLGAVAAVIAALTVEPKTWLKSVKITLGRVLQVAGVWLIVALLLHFLWYAGCGRGRGPGEGDGSSAGKTNNTRPTEPPVTVSPEEFPSNLPKSVDLMIRFVPSPGNPAVAQDFSCDLLQKDAENKGKKIEIRAQSMQEFVELLVAQLQNLNLHQQQPTILIQRSPFPGESVVQRVGDKVRMVFPDATIVFDK
jgi:hypothetical protein